MASRKKRSLGLAGAAARAGGAGQHPAPGLTAVRLKKAVDTATAGMKAFTHNRLFGRALLFAASRQGVHNAAEVLYRNFIQTSPASLSGLGLGQLYLESLSG